MTPFKESPEGQTHYVGDGCIPPHVLPTKGENTANVNVNKKNLLFEGYNEERKILTEGLTKTNNLLIRKEIRQRLREVDECVKDICSMNKEI